MIVHCLYDELLEPKKLKPHPRNPNKHDKSQIERLIQILMYQGWRYAVKVSKRSGFITSGHGRVEAAILMAWKVPVVYQDYENEDQEFADIIADNAIASWSRLDFSAINLEIPNFDPSFDIDLLGIKNFKIDVAEKEGEDELPETVEAKTKLGDLYKLGNHRLLCGDSTDAENVSTLVGSERMDMVFTDPPYNHASEEKLVSQSVSQAMKKLSESEWDKNFDISSVLINIKNVIAENCTIYVCTSWHLAGEIWAFMKQHSSHYSYCVWHKPNPMPSLMKRHWTWSSELICYATYGKHIFNFPFEGHASNVWTINKNQKNDLHPTMKPVEIPEKAIIHSSNKNQSVLDLFGGSGSTLIACEKTNRKCFMMELDPHYCDVIVTRWEKFTGQKATKLK